MDFRELQTAVHAMAVRKGWWDEGLDKGALRFDGPAGPHIIGAKLALIHSEVSEALECVRDGDMTTRVSTERPGKPEGLPSELADVVIRTMDLAEALGIDLWAAILEKDAYNATRKHRHGGRAL